VPASLATPYARRLSVNWSANFDFTSVDSWKKWDTSKIGTAIIPIQDGKMQQKDYLVNNKARRSVTRYLLINMYAEDVSASYLQRT
jgi:hypothetical protein